MKHLFAFLIVLSLLLPTGAHAQTADNTAYVQALTQVIALLMKQVEVLQARLLALEASQPQELAPNILPAGITQTNVRLDEGVPQPQLQLQTRIVHTEYFGTNKAISERETKDSEITLGPKDSLRILVLIGNPDPNFTPAFSCNRVGGWTGPVAYDQWFENVRPASETTNWQSFLFGVRCTAQDGTVSERSLDVTLK